MSNKIIVILGPTSSGKSDLAIDLAKKFGGEIISADSRQIYRGMDVGTGKIIGKLKKMSLRAKRSNLAIHCMRLPRSLRSLAMTKVFISSGIPHHMIDIVSPKTDYNVAKFKKAADKIILNTLKRGKLPIICGGTGFWIKAIVDNVNFPAVKPNWQLRQKLNKKSTAQLFRGLKKLDPERAATIDRFNKVRLIRAIEIIKTLGKVPEINSISHCDSPAGREAISGLPRSLCSLATTKNFQFLQIGIKTPKEKLNKKIKERLEARFKQGMIKEVKKLHYKNKVNWKRLESFGLEYRWIARFLQGEIAEKEMKEKLYQEIKNYSKRQMTWWKKDKRIVWLRNSKQVEIAVKEFLKQ